MPFPSVWSGLPLNAVGLSISMRVHHCDLLRSRVCDVTMTVTDSLFEMREMAGGLSVAASLCHFCG